MQFLSLVPLLFLLGFGVETPGGRGGKLLRVTNLNARGPGSLREALEARGPRIVVFEVGGAIDLGKSTLTVSEPFLTVAGQTAPSPGITIIRGGMAIRTHDVVMRHIRVRPGDAGGPEESGWEPEVSTSGPQAYNIVVDHCSFSWAVDENLSASGPRYDGEAGTSRNVTFSNNIIAEGLYDSSHAKGMHSMGTLVHDYSTNIAVIGNLYAHNNQRNPYFKAYTTGVVVNNVVYNPGAGAIRLDWPASEWEGRPAPRNGRLSVVGNVVIHGPDTRADRAAAGRKRRRLHGGQPGLRPRWPPRAAHRRRHQPAREEARMAGRPRASARRQGRRSRARPRRRAPPGPRRNGPPHPRANSRSARAASSTARSRWAAIRNPS